MSLAQLSAVLAASARLFSTDFADARFIQVYLYVHRVQGLEPGVYRYWPKNAQLEQVRSGDQRVAAAGLSLGQDLAGNACVAFSMIADIDRAVRSDGDRGYRYVHFEAGAIGQRLYLAANALGLGATGIGAFFDDEVHRYLDDIQQDCHRQCKWLRPMSMIIDRLADRPTLRYQFGSGRSNARRHRNVPNSL